MAKKRVKVKGKWKKVTLIELVVILALLAIVGNIIYHLIYWREAYEEIKHLGLVETIAVFIGALFLKRWIDKL